MPMLETPAELAERIADLVGVYGGHDDDSPCLSDLRTCCRNCFVAQVVQRIRDSVPNEKLIEARDG